MDLGNVAEWAAAIGTIGAVGAGFIAARGERRHQREVEDRRRLEAAEQRIRVAKAACNALASSLESGAKGWRANIPIVPEDWYNGLVHLTDTLAGAVELLRRFDFDGIADEALWKSYVEVQVGVLRSHAHLAAYLEQLNRRGAHPPTVLPHEADDLSAEVAYAVDLLCGFGR